MAKSPVRNRAKQHGRSIKAEVRHTLQDATEEDANPAHGPGTEISCLFKQTGLEADIPELRGHGIKPAAFD